jgi:hypothetical protein
MARKKDRLPRDYPRVSGDYLLTGDWWITLPEEFAHRIEDDDLVLWRPGMTLRLALFDNDHRATIASRLEDIREDASPDRHDERQRRGRGVTQYSYRLTDENDDGPIECVMGFALTPQGHLEMAITFDDAGDAETAQAIFASIRHGTSVVKGD